MQWSQAFNFSCVKVGPDQMFKIEVFNALQMRFGPSKYISLKIALQITTPT
jgi:hypothetical protein